MADGNQSASGGVGILGLLGVAFVVLKLCHVIDWHWAYVTLPFWGPLALLITIALLLFFGALVYVSVYAIVDKLRR